MAEPQRSIPGVWAETNPLGLAIQEPPVVATLKASAQPVRVRQFPMTPEAKLGITKYMNQFLAHGILVPCQSP